jgi:hypothetical protein
VLSGGRGAAFEIDFTQAERGLLRIQDWADIVHEPIRHAIRVTAEDVKAAAATSISRQGPPRSVSPNPPARDTGFLLRSLQIAINREKRKKGERAYVMSGKLGQNTVKFAFYGFMLESGTRRMAPRPFLVPARTRYTSVFVARVQRAIDEAIRKSTS